MAAGEELSSSLWLALCLSNARKRTTSVQLQHLAAKKQRVASTPDHRFFQMFLDDGLSLRDSSNLGPVGAKKGSIESVYNIPKQTQTDKFSLHPSSRLESLPVRVLEHVGRQLSVADLCLMSQVNNFCCDLFDKDEFWMERAAEKGIIKSSGDKSWKWNYMAAEGKLLFARRLDEAPLYLKGDITIVDPLKIFFLRKGAQKQRDNLHTLLQRYRDTDFVVTYRGIRTVFISSKFWDDDTAFEIIRKNICVGEDIAKSGVIAAIRQRLVRLLMEENSQTESQHGGVLVEGVDGEFKSSRDGDFIIRTADPISPNHWDIDHDEIDCADIICAAGGSWTISDDSSEDEDDDPKEMTEEELAKALQDMPDSLNWFEFEKRYKSQSGTEVC